MEEKARAGADLTLSLRALGYDVETLCPEQIVDRAKAEQTDLILIRMLEPDAFGLRALSELRMLPYYPALVAITGNEQSRETAMLLECGCDCVITASRDVLEVKAWIEALLRRREMYRSLTESAESVLKVGDLEIDIPARMVRTKTRSAELTDRELKLLLELAQKPGTVCRRSDLLERVWGSAAESLTGTLNTYINRLRVKIEDDFRIPKLLIGVYGIGYRLMVGGVQRPETASLSPAERKLAALPASHPLPGKKRARAASRPGS